MAWFISSISGFFGLGIYFFYWKENLSAPALIVAGCLKIPIKEQTKHFYQPFRKLPAWKRAQVTLVLIFIGQCCHKFLRFLDFFTLIYKEVLTCSLRGTQPVSLIPTRSVLTTVIYGKFNNRSSCLLKTDWQQNVFYGSSPETAQVRKAGQV